MKLVKTLFLIVVGFNVTVSLHAQNIKTELIKQEEIKPPPPPSAPAPNPVYEFKPMNGVAPVTSPATTETPSPFTKDKNVKVPGIPADLTAEQLKTFNGTLEKPKDLYPENEPQNNAAIPLTQPNILLPSK